MTIDLLRLPHVVSRLDFWPLGRNGHAAQATITAKAASVRTEDASGNRNGDAPAVVTLIEVAQLYASLETDPVKGIGKDKNRAEFERRLQQFCDQAKRACDRTSADRACDKEGSAKIKDAFFCSSLPAGAVLTGEPSNQLYVTFPPRAQAPAWITGQLIKALMLYNDLREIPPTPSGVLCLEMLFAYIVQLLRLLGNEDWRQQHQKQCRPTPLEWQQAPWPELRQVYETELRHGADLVRRMAQRQAQVDYFDGMLSGAKKLAGALLILGLALLGPTLWGAAPFGMPPQATPLLVLCPLVGGIGAIVSVMQRMTTGNCALRDRAGQDILRRVGSFRPLIGAVFASVIVALVAGGMVPAQLQTTAGDPIHFLLYGVLAFFAGFSERFAQDMLGAGKGQLNSGTEAERRAAAT